MALPKRLPKPKSRRPRSKFMAAKRLASLGGKPEDVELAMRTLTVRASSDAEYAAARQLILNMAGVSIKAEAPTRRAFAVVAPRRARTAAILRAKGLTVRDEAVYQLED